MRSHIDYGGAELLVLIVLKIVVVFSVVWDVSCIRIIK